MDEGKCFKKKKRDKVFQKKKIDEGNKKSEGSYVIPKRQPHKSDWSLGDTK